MRSLAPQLVALVLAVPVSTVASSHASRSQPVGSRTAVAIQPARSHCSAFCQARILRHRVVRVHGRTVAIAHRAALPVPPPPRLGWHRKVLRAQLTRQARVLGRYRAQARRPLRIRLERYSAWVCIHRHEGAWNDSGDPYWGGLQMDRGFMRTYAPSFLLRKGLANRWTPLEQMWVAERAHRSGRGYGPWPNTARNCGLL